MPVPLSRALSHQGPFTWCLAHCGEGAAAPCTHQPPASAAVILALVLAGVSLLVMAGCTPQIAVAAVAASGIVAVELRLRLS
ncbi:hypothetical protein ABT391_11505 [Streptomyces jumonjinensis]|uniref:hypothetical protein n=1 Tax=Streptomyces jumonjinensis TaxID=1945 RepID=UPI00332A4A35